MTVENADGWTRAGAAVFRPVRDGNAFEETVERLLQSIKLGVVAPGERLPPERELATRFKVSRVTLREALRALGEAGYVESRRGRYGGTFVREQLPRREPDRAAAGWHRLAADFEDVMLLRDVLEVGTAEAAASADLSQGERLHLRERAEACRSAPLSDYRRTDSRFHLALAEVTGSASLTAAVADVRMRTNDYLDAIPLIARNIGHSNDQHQTVVDAVLAGDPERARLAMAEHLSGTAALLRGFLS